MRLLFLVLILVIKSSAFVLTPTRRAQRSLSFNNEDRGEKDDAGWLRFLPRVVRAKIKKSYAVPEPDSSLRWHLRLLPPPDRSLKRHTITRLLRFLPDLKWETAEAIVDTAILKERALVRVYNSKQQAQDIARDLALADPPIVCEIFDARTNELLV